MDKLGSKGMASNAFLSIVRKYTRARKLTIHYNCVGGIFIPDTDSLPIPDVTVNTRRGVFVTYAPQSTAV